MALDLELRRLCLMHFCVHRVVQATVDVNKCLHVHGMQGGNPSKASSLIQDVRSAASIPDEILLQSLVLETYDRGSKSARDCLLELLDSSDVHMPKSIREMTVHNLDNC